MTMETLEMDAMLLAKLKLQLAGHVTQQFLSQYASYVETGKLKAQKLATMEPITPKVVIQHAQEKLQVGIA
jgi:hypothetical protein